MSRKFPNAAHKMSRICQDTAHGGRGELVEGVKPSRRHGINVPDWAQWRKIVALHNSPAYSAVSDARTFCDTADNACRDFASATTIAGGGLILDHRVRLDVPRRNSVHLAAPAPLVFRPSLDTSHIFLDLFELIQASIQVVALRTTRLAFAGPLPDEQDRREIDLMSFEKGEAASESILALSTGWVDLAMTLAKNANEQFVAATSAAAMLVSNPSSAQWSEHQAELWRLAAKLPAVPLELAGLATNLLEDTIAPYRRRVTANAKRLSA
nr:polyhydroxyalkanoate granule-associated phasin [uncultured Cupriavidus sp.]